MTLSLRCGMEVKTVFPDEVSLITPDGEIIEININDFLSAVYYVLTNTNLVKNDPRKGFLEVIRNINIISGYPTMLLRDGKEETIGSPMRLQYEDYPSLCSPNWETDK